MGRYKAVLLKQRDIMIALTARLNERDETVIRMQEELKAYDGEYRRVEDALDAKTAELIALRRAAMRHSAESPGARNDELVAALGGWAGDKENPQNLLSASGDETPRRPFGVGATEVRDDASDSSLVSELESARGELRAKSADPVWDAWPAQPAARPELLSKLPVALPELPLLGEQRLVVRAQLQSFDPQPLVRRQNLSDCAPIHYRLVHSDR